MQIQQVESKEVYAWIKYIEQQILLSGKKYDYVVGIEKGGLFLSKPLSKLLGIPHKSVRISFYDKSISALDPIVETNEFVWHPNGLLADDLIDQGRTISKFFSLFGEMDIAVLLWEPEACYYTKESTYYGAIKPEGWVVFPWEQ